MALLLITFSSLVVTVGSMQAGLAIFSGATDQVPMATYTQTTTVSQLVGAAMAYGRSTWMLYTAEADQYARVTPGIRQVFNPTMGVINVVIEELDCLTRYKGIGSKLIIPNSAFTGMTSLYTWLPPDRARLTAPQSGWVMKSLPSWLEIDLGVNFRLYKILTLGGAYQSVYTGPYTYQMYHRLATSEYVTYQENNVTRIFISHPPGGPAWSVLVTNELADHVIGRMFKIEILTGSSTNPTFRVEFVGCDCEPGPEVPIVRHTRKTYLTKAREISDSDPSTCVTVTLPVTVFAPFPAMVQDNMTVTAITKRDPSCPAYDPKELYPMVKLTPPFRTLSLEGTFSKCGFLENTEGAELSTQVFNCTCALGVCEGVYMRVTPPCTLQLCDVDVY